MKEQHLVSVPLKYQSEASDLALAQARDSNDYLADPHGLRHLQGSLQWLVAATRQIPYFEDPLNLTGHTHHCSAITGIQSVEENTVLR